MRDKFKHNYFRIKQIGKFQSPSKTTEDGFEFVWQISFKFADIVFKIISWTIIYIIVQAIPISDNKFWIYAIVIIIELSYSAVLLSLALYLLTKDVREFGFIGPLQIPARIALIIVGIGTSLFLFSPTIPINTLVDGLIAARSR